MPPRLSLALSHVLLLLVLVLLLAPLASEAHAARSTATLGIRLTERHRERLHDLHTHQVQQLSAGAAAASGAGGYHDDLKTAQHKSLISNVRGKTAGFSSPSQQQQLDKHTLFTAPFAFGGSQVLELTLDTGSAIMWVTSNTCASSECFTHKGFDSQASSTFRELDPKLSFEVTYGSGEVRGVLALERVGFFGETNITVPSQLFGLAEVEHGRVFSTSRWSGILGLGYPQLGSFRGIRASEYPPFFDSVMRLKLLDSNAFSFALGTSPPMFYLGSPPQHLYAGALRFFPVVDKYYWTLRLEDVLVDGTSLGLCPDRNCRVVIDSGTSYMGVPTRDLGRVVHALTGRGGGHEACQTPVENRTISYVLEGGEAFSLGPSEYFKRSTSGDVCKVAYFGMDVDPPHGPVHILGDSFFRRYFLYFDRDRDRVGIAEYAAAGDDSLLQLQSELRHSLGA